MMDAADPPYRGAPRDDGAIVALTDVCLRSAEAARDTLHAIDLAVVAGESVAIVGQPGAGKSALVSLIAGLVQPSRGTVRVAGQILGELDEAALARLRRDTIGIVAPPFRLAPTMTAIENVAGPALSAHPAAAFDKARASLEAVGLGRRLAHYPAQLSPGDELRVVIARACIGAPALLLADEPTHNLDVAAGQDAIGALLDMAARSSTAVVLATRDEAIARRCQRIVRLADGRIVGNGIAPAK